MNSRSYLTFTFVIAFCFAIVFSQGVWAYTCPDFVFGTDMQQGARNPDVAVMQEILNLDKRTLVAYSGPGSKGNETSFFGIATREALKRFQALFIEYIGIANGKFGPKTRTTMNAVCKGPFFTGGSGNVYDLGTSTKETIPPVIAIAGPTSTDVTVPFRAYLGASEALSNPTLQGLIVENATAGDLRKTSSTTWSFLVTPNQDATESITLQFEADTLADLAGNKNATASNEWVVDLTGISVATDTEEIIFPDIIFPTASGTDCSAVPSVDVNDVTNPCYGKVPMTNNQNMSQEQQQDQQMMQMLSQLLQSLMGALKQSGGQTGGDANCGCTGLPTTGYMPIGPGIPGRNITLGVENSGSFYTGYQGPPPGICGVRPRNGPKDPCSGIPGPHNASCCGITSDVTMGPVTGTLSPKGKRSK